MLVGLVVGVGDPTMLGVTTALGVAILVEVLVGLSTIDVPVAADVVAVGAITSAVQPVRIRTRTRIQSHRLSRIIAHAIHLAGAARCVHNHSGVDRQRRRLVGRSKSANCADCPNRADSHG